MQTVTAQFYLEDNFGVERTINIECDYYPFIEASNDEYGRPDEFDTLEEIDNIDIDIDGGIIEHEISLIHRYFNQIESLKKFTERVYEAVREQYYKDIEAVLF